MNASDEKALPPSANIAPTPATNIQVIEDATTADALKDDKSTSSAEKKKAEEAGLKNYFVWASVEAPLHHANASSESLYVRDQT
jgi:hypothetical protein